MKTSIFNIILFISSIYFFYQFEFFFAVVLLIWLLLRILGLNVGELGKSINEIIQQFEAEKKANLSIQLFCDLNELLKHPKVDNLYASLVKHKCLDKGMNKSKWKQRIIENYKIKYNENDSRINTKFNIKNNVLWQDEKINFMDDIYHELFIPYDEIKRDEEKEYFNETISVGLSIRMFIVNGIIKLQIGSYPKFLSPEILNESEFMGVYRVYDTITSFPLLYFPYQSNLPEKYLNLSINATDSYWNNKREELGKDDKDWTSDWEKINREVQDYLYVSHYANQYISNTRKRQSIVDDFNKKKEVWLEKENFKDLNPETELYDRFRTDELHYQNTFLRIYILNINDYREKREEFVYPDYYEESPL